MKITEAEYKRLEREVTKLLKGTGGTMSNEILSPFEQWMVKSNLENIKTQGFKSVVNRLEAQGYHRVRNAVVKEYARQRMQAKVKRVLRNQA